MRNKPDIPLELKGTVPSLSQNISKSGMLCWTSRKIDELTLLNIKFELPHCSGYTASRTWFECSGVVVRCEKKEAETLNLPFEVAIFFNKISEKNLKLLDNYIANGNH